MTPCAEKKSRVKVHIFRCHPHFAFVVLAEPCCDVIDVRHGANVDPSLQHSHNDVSEAETEALDQHDAFVCVGIISRTRSSPVTEMHGARRSWLVISDADRYATSTPSSPAIAPR